MLTISCKKRERRREKQIQQRNNKTALPGSTLKAMGHAVPDRKRQTSLLNSCRGRENKEERRDGEEAAETEPSLSSPRGFANSRETRFEVREFFRGGKHGTVAELRPHLSLKHFHCQQNLTSPAHQGESSIKLLIPLRSESLTAICELHSDTEKYSHALTGSFSKDFQYNVSGIVFDLALTFDYLLLINF